MILLPSPFVTIRKDSPNPTPLPSYPFLTYQSYLLPSDGGNPSLQTHASPFFHQMRCLDAINFSEDTPPPPPPQQS